MADNQRGSTTSVQAALVPLLVMGLTAVAVKMKVDSKEIGDNIYALAVALAALLAGGYNWLLTHVNDQKVQKAETLAPGITKMQVPDGMELKVTTSINDPATPDPPTVLSETTTKSSDIPEVKPMKVIKQLLFSLFCMALMILPLGCQTSSTTTPPPLSTEVVTIGSDAATIALLQGIKSPTQRSEVAKATALVAKAVYDAAGPNPDFTALKAVALQQLAKWNSPYQPLVEALLLQVIADAQANLPAASTPQVDAAKTLIQAAMVGVQFGAQAYIDTPTTQPGG